MSSWSWGMESASTRGCRALPVRWKKSRLACSSPSVSTIKVPHTVVKAVQSLKHLFIAKILLKKNMIRTLKEEPTAPFLPMTTCQSGRSIHKRQRNSSQCFARALIYPFSAKKVINLKPHLWVALSLEVMVLIQKDVQMESCIRIHIWWRLSQAPQKHKLSVERRYLY